MSESEQRAEYFLIVSATMVKDACIASASGDDLDSISLIGSSLINHKLITLFTINKYKPNGDIPKINRVIRRIFFSALAAQEYGTADKPLPAKLEDRINHCRTELAELV